jgi:hypothetical protein
MNMMAISTEHLGQQVQCPHCQAVVQTPDASAFGLAPPPGPDPVGAQQIPQYSPPPPQYTPQYSPPPQPPVHDHREDIFGEAPPSDDVFDAPSHGHAHQQPAAMHEESHTAVAEAQPEEIEEADDEEPADLSAMRARLAAARQSSNLAPTILVFLVPYAICCTGFIAYLLYMWPTIERLDYLPDPRPGKQRPGQVFVPAHNSKLAANRKIPIGESVRIGDIEFTPLAVTRTAGGDLQLDFKAKNISSKVAFVPIEMEFFHTEPKKLPKHYTFLEYAGQDTPRIFGGYVQYYDTNFDKERKVGGELQPNEEELIRLTTEMKYRDEAEKYKGGHYLWRLQLRRGNVVYHGGEIPVSAVVGVEFSDSDIKKG